MLNDNDVGKTLKERGSVYGEYKWQNQTRADMLQMFYDRYLHEHGELPSPEDITRVYDIINKLSRLLVSPKHLDTWKDIAGYAMLAYNDINEDK